MSRWIQIKHTFLFFKKFFFHFKLCEKFNLLMPICFWLGFMRGEDYSLFSFFLFISKVVIYYSQIRRKRQINVIKRDDVGKVMTL